jgi:hypothetical protein
MRRGSSSSVITGLVVLVVAQAEPLVQQLE